MTILFLAFIFLREKERVHGRMDEYCRGSGRKEEGEMHMEWHKK